MNITRTMTLTVTKGEGTTTRVIASTDSVDRMGDVVEQEWNLDHYKANPVILQNHDYRSPVVGRATEISLVRGPEGSSLEMQIEWDKDPSNPDGQRIASQFERGFMSAVSVGFRPGKVTPRSDLPEDHKHYGAKGYVLSANELLEVSAVPVPANAEALAKGLESTPALSADDVRAILRAELADEARAAVNAANALAGASTTDPLEVWWSVS
jgi:HK97 family phage prohead protease